MKRFLFPILFALLSLIGRADDLTFPEYVITDAHFQHAIDSAYLYTQAPDFVGDNWIAYGYIYLSADYGWNGMRRPPVVDTTTWHLVLMFDEGICHAVAGGFEGVVNLHGHWILLDWSLLESKLFAPTGKTCKVVPCKDAEDEFSGCECLHDDLPSLINYSFPAVSGVSTKDFIVLGKPVPAAQQGKDTIYTEADVMPVYIAGEDSLQRLIDSKRTRLLDEGEKSDGVYVIKVSIVVEKNGVPEYTRVEESCGNWAADRIAQNMFRSYYKPRWHPGLINGEPVRVRIYRTVIFDCPDNGISPRILHEFFLE